MTTASTLQVVIPVKDETLHLAHCIGSVQGLWPVVVVDGGSTDGTVELARGLGAKVLEHEWAGYSDQKNWALRNLPEKSEWVLFLDADERLTDEVRQEIRSVIDDTSAAGFAIPRQYVFLGKPLRHAWWYPDYQLRLFRPGRGRFEERRVHEHPVIDGPVEYLRHPLIHENRKGLSAFVERHNRYSDLEAAERLSPSAGRRRGALRGSYADKRRALKERVWYRLPFKPAIRFWWLYIFRLGFLDGRRGLLFCRLISHYEFLIDAKVLERSLCPIGDRNEMPAMADVGAQLACPSCRSPLGSAPEALECAVCGHRYPVVDGIPVLTTDAKSADDKARQAQWFDHETDSEWEIERPAGAPRLHRWVLNEKFTRSLQGLRNMDGMSALTVCGGSGMDAEFLALAGGKVVCADISLGACRRAAERARRHGIDITPVVADAERLPFADRSFDLVYVHDGLHHLQHPYMGLSEMLRVAARAVSITEPADAALTRVAVHAGAAEDVEEAGSRVARMRLPELFSALEDAHYMVVHAERYAMFYRHEPRWAMRFFSHEPMLTVAKGALRGGNHLLGRAGNKLVVVATRG